jgi:integrase/recombinase XerD
MEAYLREFSDWLHTRNYAATTRKNHYDDVSQFLHWLAANQASPDLKLVKRKTLETYRDQLLDILQPRSVCRHLSSLKIFFRCAETLNWVPVNHMHRVTFPQIPARPPELLSTEEIVTLLETPSPTHYLGLRDRAMLELMFSSGLKVNELLTLNVEDLYLDLAFLKVRGKRERMVPVTQKAVEALRDYLAEARPSRLRVEDDPCLFPNRDGARMTRIGFWFMVKKHAKAAGIQNNINARILRHSFAAHLLENGLGLLELYQILGYASLDSTLQYAHINRPDYAEEFRRYHPSRDLKPPETA